VLWGYRARGVDYEKGSGATEYDVVQHGPIVGLAVRY
jgi:hypothetical protein